MITYSVQSPPLCYVEIQSPRALHPIFTHFMVCTTTSRSSLCLWPHVTMEGRFILSSRGIFSLSWYYQGPHFHLAHQRLISRVHLKTSGWYKLLGSWATLNRLILPLAFVSVCVLFYIFLKERPFISFFFVDHDNSNRAYNPDSEKRRARGEHLEKSGHSDVFIQATLQKKNKTKWEARGQRNGSSELFWWQWIPKILIEHRKK